MTRYRISLSPCELSLERDPLREPPRPVALRHEDYEDNFDFSTLFFDCFWNSSHDAIILIGPPSFRLDQSLGLQIRAYPSGITSQPRSLAGAKVRRLSLKVPRDTTGIAVQAGEAEFFLAPQPNLSDLFRDRRVVTTLSKNNPIEWITDWARYHREIHKCDAVLFYDNDSTRYTIHDLDDALGLEGHIVVIVSWPFKYGVSDWRKPLSTGFNDSLYAQPGMLEHARLRFLSASKSVLNADIDELIVTQNASSVFELVEKSTTGYLEFPGRWVENYPFASKSLTDALPRHKEFAHIEQPERIRCRGKWAVVPTKTPLESQWDIHTVLGMKPSDPDEWVELRHFRAINTNWNRHKSWSESLRTARPTAHDGLKVDVALRAALDRAFGGADEGLAFPERPGSSSSSAYRLRLRAGRLAAQRKWPEAIAAIQDALRLMPEHPGLHLYLADLETKVGDVTAAKKHKARGRALREKDPWYHFQLGRWHQAKDELEAARQCFEEAIGADPSFTAAYSRLARVQKSLGRPDRALPILRTCRELASQDPMAHVHLAEALETEKRLPEALKCWEAAVRLDPKNLHFQARKASLFRRLGRLGEAEEALRAGLACNSLALQMKILEERWSIARYLCEPKWHRPTAPELFAELAEVMVEKEDLAAAELAARQALADRRKAPDRYLRLAEIIRLRGKEPTADPEVKAGLANHRAFRERLTKFLMKTGQASEVERFLLGALAVEPQDGALYFWLSQVLTRLQRPEEAVDAARRAIENDPPVAKFRGHLAALLQQRGNFQEAENVLRQAMKDGVKNGVIHYRMSRLLKKRGCLLEALMAASSAVFLEPKKVNYRLHWAMLLMEAGREGEAEPVLISALELDPRNGELHFQLSQVLQRLRRPKEAVQAARRATEAEPQAAKFQEHLASLLGQLGDVSRQTERVGRPQR